MILVLKYIHLFILCFIINPTIKRIIITFLFSLNIVYRIFFRYFFKSKLFLICFLRLYFVKRSSDFFSVKITNNRFLRYSVSEFLNNKNFFRLIWKIAFCKNIFVFWYYNIITNFKFRTFLIILFMKVNICDWLYVNRFHFNCSMCCCIF